MAAAFGEVEEVCVEGIQNEYAFVTDVLKEKELRLEAKRQKKSLQAKKELVKILKSQLDELKITIKNNSSDFVDKVIYLQNILSNYINSQK